MTTDNNALDLELFDNRVNGYIPEELPKKKSKPMKLLRRNYESGLGAILGAEFRRKLAVRACAFAFATLLIAGSLLYFRVAVTEKRIELQKAQAELEAAKSEYITLSLERDEWLSPEKVQKYAREKLDMEQIENCQKKYFDLSGSDGAMLTQ